MSVLAMKCDGAKAAGKAGVVKIAAFDAPASIVDQLKDGTFEIAIAQHRHQAVGIAGKELRRRLLASEQVDGVNLQGLSHAGGSRKNGHAVGRCGMDVEVHGGLRLRTIKG